MKLAKTTSAFVLLFFVGTMFVSLLQMATISNTNHGCPSMGHEDSICLMSFAEYMNSWKSTYLATTTYFATNLLLLSLLIIATSVAPNLLKKSTHLSILLRFRQRDKQTYKLPFFLQDLFSNGILNPKLF